MAITTRVSLHSSSLPLPIKSRRVTAFKSHGSWMEATHYRTGEKALLSYNVSKAPELPTMNTCLIRPEEATPCLSQGKLAQEHAPLAGHEKSRTPMATPVEEQNQTSSRRIRDRSWVMRACSTLWAALAIAGSLFEAPL